MLKQFYFSTILLFVLIKIFLLTTTMPRKRSNHSRALGSAQYKRRKLKITASVQGIDAVEEIHQAETNTVPVQGIDAVEEIHQAETNTVPVQDVVVVEEVHPDETYTNNNHVCYDDGNEANKFYKDDTPTNDNPIPDLVPSLCEFIDKKALQAALKYLTRTKIEGTTNEHQACVCAACDSFIIGTEKIFY